MEKTPTPNEILDNEEMRALACMGALALNRLDLCVALLTGNFELKNLNEETLVSSKSFCPKCGNKGQYYDPIVDRSFNCEECNRQNDMERT